MKNYFKLYYIDNIFYSQKDRSRAIKVSKQIQDILNKLIEKMAKTDITDDYKKLMIPLSNKIILLQSEKVGVGDTETDKMMCHYLKRKLSIIFNKNNTEEMVETFYSLIH